MKTIYYGKINKYVNYESKTPQEIVCRGRDKFSVLAHPTEDGCYVVESPVFVVHSSRTEAIKGKFFVPDDMVTDEPKFPVVNRQLAFER